MSNQSDASVPLDIIWGASAIAAAIKRNTRETYYLLENGHLNGAKKVGGRWCVSQRKLAELFEAPAAG